MVASDDYEKSFAPPPGTIRRRPQKLIKNYAPNSEPVQAIKLTEANMEEAANWCGGEVTKDKPQTLDQAWDDMSVLLVPSIRGAVEGRAGEYLVKTRDNKFRIESARAFEEDYHEVGLRQDGIQMRDREKALGPLINPARSVERTPVGWGKNSDCP